MGGSDENVMIGNEMGWNGIMPANAPTGQYGNSGISMTGWSSEHEIIVDNYIHDNAGAGIGMMSVSYTHLKPLHQRGKSSRRKRKGCYGDPRG